MQQKIYPAHINDADEMQSLKQHCEAVAIYTAETMRKVQLYHLGSITGLIHDLGKATDSFNDYLCRAHDGEAVKRGSVNHKKGEGVSVGVRGPVSVHMARSVSPIDITSMQITKSVNGEPSEKKSSDTMGTRHMVDFGLYEIKGSINVQLAEKTGFTEEDAAHIKECLRTLFINDTSSARPDGSMEVVCVYWWEHNCKDGQYSSAKVHRSVEAKLKADVKIPSDFSDYDIVETGLDGLVPEIIAGM